MSDREELAKVILNAWEHNYYGGTPSKTAAFAAADAILSRRPADDLAMVARALGAYYGASNQAYCGDATQHASDLAGMAAALSVYRDHDPRLREALGRLSRLAEQAAVANSCLVEASAGLSGRKCELAGEIVTNTRDAICDALAFVRETEGKS